MAGRTGWGQAQDAASLAVAEALEVPEKLNRVALTMTAPAENPAQAVVSLAAGPDAEAVTPAAGWVRTGPGPLVRRLLFRGEAHTLVQAQNVV